VADDKRQKVLLGVLAVAAIAAGGYFFILRDTGPKVQKQTAAPLVKKERKVSTNNEKKGRKVRKEAKQSRETTVRKERERADSGPKQKKVRKKAKKKTKKKKMSPAA